MWVDVINICFFFYLDFIKRNHINANAHFVRNQKKINGSSRLQITQNVWSKFSKTEPSSSASPLADFYSS